ncbi:hypothetical protein [Paenibacillus sp. RC334]|uniref:hypothetical protein n=1 Tax=Paenibacillus sp. RC334 TaxID=3045840 RepID=UPI0024BBBE47|nr:hypothetical protein [Paenibacillus sp. RC334]
MNKIFPKEYPKYQTSLFVVCKSNHSEMTLKDICNSERYSNNIKVYINTRFENIIFVTFFPHQDKIKFFEKVKKEFIESLSNVCSYISIAYDNQTIIYMKEISESVYILEREFRTLIEIIFLKEMGINWYSHYFQNSENEKDRVRKRDKILHYLNNPLDSLDFVHLKNFVEERIKFSKNVMSDKLDTIKDELASFASSNDNTQQLYEKILDNLEEVKKLSGLKKTLEVSNLYQHITSELADEWKNLYDYRNPWAHNHCLLTRSELEKYRELASSVLKKIRTEITLLSLLEDGAEFKIQSDIITLNLTNFSRLGTPFCRLKLQIKSSASQQHILEIIEATYVEVVTVLDVLKKYADYNDSEISLENLKLNPFFIDNLKSFGENLFKSGELQEKNHIEFRFLGTILFEREF